MIKNKKLLFSIPLIIMGIFMIILGLRWMIVEEPWMLDQVANEERLEMPFNDLFKPEINKTLPGYLKQIYRFFGLWVIIIGMFISLFSRQKIVKDKEIRLTLLICIGMMVYCGIILGYILIPSSPFIYLGWGLIILHLISLVSHLNID
tara:strand:- start:213 stop:656 length:444 start_codon:yes stop_codon:yes gene_type:complete